MLQIYKSIHGLRDSLLIVPLWLSVKILGVISKLTFRNKRERSVLQHDSLDAIPRFVASSDILKGVYCVNGRTRYCIKRDRIKLITLDLSTFTKEEKILQPGDRVSIEPLVIHAFIDIEDSNEKCEISRISQSGYSYSFDIDMREEYNLVPDGFRLDSNRLQIIESILRLGAFKYLARSMTCINVGHLLYSVRATTMMLKCTAIECTVAYGIACDLIQRADTDKERHANIGLGAYKRILSSSGNSYHDIRATEIGLDGGPIIHWTHRTHFDEKRLRTIPYINLGHNVIIEMGTYLDVGLGLSIGDFTWIASGARFLKHDHSPSAGGQLSRTVDNTIFYPTEIGSHILLGQNATVLSKACYIGKGSVIGYKAVVAASVGDYSIVAGNPARLLRYNVDLAKKLEDSEGEKYLTDETESDFDYSSIQQIARNSKCIVIVGAASPARIIQAAMVFKKVLILLYPSSRIVSLLNELNKQRIRNVSIYSGKMTISEELRQRRPFAVEFFQDQMVLEEFCESLYAVIRENAFAIIAPKDGKVHRKMMQQGEGCSVVRELSESTVILVFNRDDH